MGLLQIKIAIHHFFHHIVVKKRMKCYGSSCTQIMVSGMKSILSLLQLRAQLKQQQHRALVILSGSYAWQNAVLAGLWTDSESVLWIGETEKNIQKTIQATVQTIEPIHVSERLGQEVDSVIIDVQKGLNANTLGIASGMIRAGGLFVLLTPDVDTWATLPNPDNQRFLNSPYQIKDATPYFTQHLIQQWQADSDTPAIWLHEAENSSATPSITLPKALQTTFKQNTKILPPPLPTEDQIQAIQAIDSVAFGHRKRPLVLSADRGRGKTSVLGLAAIHCLMEGKSHIVLTASRLEQTKVAFIQAQEALSALQATQAITVLSQQAGRIHFELDGQSKLFEFIAPDQLIIEASSADVLMVDEAAHLPTPMLTKLLMHHHRMVFATTLHGYEGSGRGFELRFKETLNQFTPDWKNLHLKTPIRWATKDPLEAAINHALFLDVTGHTTQSLNHAPIHLLMDVSIELTEIPVATLLNDTVQFNHLFRLLVQAHYQTSPNDLQLLLSAPNLKIVVAKQHEQLIGVVLCVEEGKIMPTTKRVHGHLVPQLLVKHYAQSNFLMLSSWRIMRIAVHPDVQREGIGKQLLNHVKHLATQQRIDYLSSSFGAHNTLLPFWFQQNFIPVHVGIKRDKSSGSHNMVVTKVLTPAARQALASIQRGFQTQFPHLLIESLPHFSSTMTLDVLKTFRFKTSLPHLEEAANHFRLGQRVYESVSGKLWEWSIRHGHELALAPDKIQAIWCDKVLKKQPWAMVAQRHQLAGRKGVEKGLIDMLMNQFL
ncbi:tRNA cytosine(34) acetyltransferase [hydrothermal vent metagenome]|uniref:tRNA cytosine(34) acetyltransferase n=1 Tax=hydrothermal vent metagenome TaxID=652676 RepID=A0A3B0W329_9ZZZZ